MMKQGIISIEQEDTFADIVITSSYAACIIDFTGRCNEV